MTLKEAISKQSRPFEVIEQTKKKFLAVRDALEINTREYRLAYAKPLKFYFYHNVEQAIEILKSEAKQNNRTSIKPSKRLV